MNTPLLYCTLGILTMLICSRGFYMQFKYRWPSAHDPDGDFIVSVCLGFVYGFLLPVVGIPLCWAMGVFRHGFLHEKK